MSMAEPKFVIIGPHATSAHFYLLDEINFLFLKKVKHVTWSMFKISNDYHLYLHNTANKNVTYRATAPVRPRGHRRPLRRRPGPGAARPCVILPVTGLTPVLPNPALSSPSPALAPPASMSLLRGRRTVRGPSRWLAPPHAADIPHRPPRR
jgi:hypothetical protein